jgi:hypothetical protein
MLLHMKIKQLAFLGLLTFLFVTPTVAESKLGYLHKYVGRSQINIPGEPYRNIYRTRPLQRRLVKLLGWKYYDRLLNDCYVMGGVALAGNDYIVADCCEHHNCDENSSFMAVNLRRGDVHVAFYKLGKLEWFHSKGTVRDLPREVLDNEWFRNYGPFVKSTTEVTRRAT